MQPLDRIAVTQQQNAQWATADAVLARRARVGANWFYWIAGLTVLNTVLGLANTDVSFLNGLFVTQIVDAFGQMLASPDGAGGPTPLAAGGLDLGLAGVCALCGYLARGGQTWAFLAGIALFALDTLGMLVFGLLLVPDALRFILPSFALHGFALYALYRGVQAHLALHRLRRARAAIPGLPPSMQPPTRPPMLVP